VFTAIKLMYLGAAVELATTLTIVATLGNVRSSVIQRRPGLTDVQWRAAVIGHFKPLVVAAGIAVGLWLWMAWANGRGHRWARVVFAMFFGVNLYGLFNGLVQGSAVYARADLAMGIVLCLVQLAAVTLVFSGDLRKIAVSWSGVGRVSSQ
jgi:hypothetical protein